MSCHAMPSMPDAPPAADFPSESEQQQPSMLGCRSISRSFSKSSVCGEDTPISLSQGSFTLSQFDLDSFGNCDDVMDQVEESLSQVSTDLRVISRKNSRCLEPVSESQECLWALDSKCEMTSEGIGSRSDSSHIPSSILGKRSMSAGYMAAEAHPYDGQDGLVFATFPVLDDSGEEDGASSAPTPDNSGTPVINIKEGSIALQEKCITVKVETAEFVGIEAKTEEQQTSDRDEVGEPLRVFAQCGQFGWNISSWTPFSTEYQENPQRQEVKMSAAKRRKFVISGGRVTHKTTLTQPKEKEVEEDEDICCTQRPPEEEETGADLTLRVLAAIARTEEGRSLLDLACNSNKKCRFSYSQPELIPPTLREQVLARITYDPSMRGTANRSDHSLPAREHLPPMIDSLCRVGVLDGIEDMKMEVLEQPEGEGGGAALRVSCMLDGREEEWQRQACSSCGSCFSRFMYEEGKYTEFRKITRELSAGQQDWGAIDGHCLCEPCYRHFTKYGHLHNPRRLSLSDLARVLQGQRPAENANGTPHRSTARRTPQSKGKSKGAVTTTPTGPANAVVATPKSEASRRSTPPRSSARKAAARCVLDL